MAQLSLIETTPPKPVHDGIVDGRYQLRRVLARGGAGRVYAAEHIFTHRMVALKLAHDSDGHSMRRARREIDVLSLVRGPGVVEILDAGLVDESPYIALELLEGRTLGGLLAARGKLSVSETLKVGIEVSEALARCHANGVVHRDVKPSNLFVTMQERVVLLDFGIAKLIRPSDGWHERLTGDHGSPGTPEYMAPEALLGSSVDHRADQYGLGVTLYECLTGTVPFDGKQGEILLKLSAKGARPVNEVCPEIPRGVSDVLQRCLDSAPGDRFGSAAELSAALRHCLSRESGSVNLLGRGPGREAQSRDATTVAGAPTAKQAHVTSRRRYPRVPYLALARIVQEDGTTIDGRVEEVSEGGLQFVGDRAIVEGEMVRIRFALPASGRITEASAHARWNRSIRGNTATGFEFSEIAESARAEIGKYAEIMRAD